MAKKQMTKKGNSIIGMKVKVEKLLNLVDMQDELLAEKNIKIQLLEDKVRELESEQGNFYHG